MKRFDLYLIFLFLLLSVGSGWWGYELYMGNGSTKSRPVGSFALSENDVFKKGEEDFFYSPVGSGKDVFENDQITTGIESQADITLGKGRSSILLKELSHIVIRSKGKTLDLEIKSGNVEATIYEGETVLIDGSRSISAKNGSARLLYMKNQDGSQFKVLDGEVSFMDGDQKRNVKASPGLAGNSTIRLEEPLQGAYVSNVNGKVKFRWSDTKEKSKYRLKIFEKNKLVNALSTTDREVTFDLPHEGDFDWFVEDLQTPENNTSIARFKLGKKPFFTPLTPSPLAVMTLKTGVTNQEVSFTWDQANPADVVLLIERIESDGTTTAPQEVPQKVDTKGSLVVDLTPGHFKWTLKSAQNQSESNTFRIMEEELPLLDPPKISDIKQEISDRIRKQGVAFSWPPVPEAGGYEIEFKTKINPSLESGTRLPMKAVGESTYRVRTLNKKNLAGRWSELKKVIVYQPKPLPLAVQPPPPPPPPPAPPPPPPMAKPAPEYSWNGIEIPKIIAPDSATDIISRGEMTEISVVVVSKTCNDYEIEVDESAKFLNPTIMKLDNGKGVVSLSKGSYQIRARCWKDGDMGSWSVIRKFNIQ